VLSVGGTCVEETLAEAQLQPGSAWPATTCLASPTVHEPASVAAHPHQPRSSRRERGIQIRATLLTRSLSVHG
jgi:hypothetical protein